MASQRGGTPDNYPISRHMLNAIYVVSKGLKMIHVAAVACCSLLLILSQLQHARAQRKSIQSLM